MPSYACPVCQTVNDTGTTHDPVTMNMVFDYHCTRCLHDDEDVSLGTLASRLLTSDGEAEVTEDDFAAYDDAGGSIDTKQVRDED